MTLALVLLIGFFTLALLARHISGKNICALCVSVFLTWVSILVLVPSGIIQDKIVLGILMGGSAVGFVYYASSRSSPAFQIFKFPLLISLFWLVYLIISSPARIPLADTVILGVLWFLFGFIYIFYKNSKMKEIGRRIIECCKNW